MLMRFSLRTLLASAVLVLSATGLAAQSNYSNQKATGKFSIGGGFSLGVTIPTPTLDSNMEPTPGFSYRIGVNARYPFARTVAGTLAFGLDGRQVGTKVSGQPEGSNYNFSYFFIEPGVQISAFRVGMNIGMPMGAKEPDPLDPTGNQVDAADDAQEMLLEPRLGATLVLMEDQKAWLGLNVDLGLALNTFYSESSASFTEKGIPGAKAFNVAIGATYQFGL